MFNLIKLRIRYTLFKVEHGLEKETFQKMKELQKRSIESNKHKVSIIDEHFKQKEEGFENQLYNVELLNMCTRAVKNMKKDEGISPLLINNPNIQLKTKKDKNKRSY